MIKTEKLTTKYVNQEEEKTVLFDIDLEIKKGEFVAVLGHNGSGKSTLAKHFNAIMLPSSGKVWVDGMDTSDEKHLYDIRQKTGMVFQNPDNQMVATVVEDDVAFAPENLGVPREEIRKRVDFALKAVGMYEYRHRSPQYLSGGQKQRVAIAGIIAMEPEYIVLDEPTAMLDPVGREEVMNTILRLNKEQHLTVILITHYMNEAVKANRVIVLDKGKILMDDTPANIFPQVSRLKSIGLDVPQSTELLYELNKSGVDISVDSLDADSCTKTIFDVVRKAGVTV
ncbi:MAG: energy-coupling factor transporter ATPase [Bacillota bacterium]|nr:energy-coupling factor transporter ATPase [Bacillota bacterium]